MKKVIIAIISIIVLTIISLSIYVSTIDWNKPVKRFPTYEDMRYCSWASIVAGSRGMAVYREGKYKSLSVNPYEKTNAPDFNQRLGKVLQEINQEVTRIMVWLIKIVPLTLIV